MIAIAALGLLLLLAFGGIWNSPSPSGEGIPDLPAVPAENIPDASSSGTESNDVLPDEANNIDNDSGASAETQQISDSNATSFISDEAQSAATGISILEALATNSVTSGGSNNVVYASTGHGHRSHSSSSNDGISGTSDSEGNESSDNNDQNNEDQSVPDDGDSFFVLPESPVGAIAMTLTSIGVLGGFLYIRQRSSFTP